MGGGVALDGIGCSFSACAAPSDWRQRVCLHLTVKAAANVNTGQVTCVEEEGFSGGLGDFTEVLHSVFNRSD